MQPVVACLFAHGGGKRRSRYVTYSFTVAGSVYGRTESVSSATYDAAQIGGPIEVVYFPSDPKVCRAGEPIWWTGIIPFFAVGLLASAASLACMVIGARDIQRKIHLIADGVPALGIIDSVEIGYRKKCAYVRSVAYTYLVMHGGKSETRRATLGSNVPYLPGEVATGDTIIVVVDPHDSSGHEIDCFAARDDEKARLLAEAERINPRGKA